METKGDFFPVYKTKRAGQRGIVHDEGASEGRLVKGRDRCIHWTTPGDGS